MQYILTEEEYKNYKEKASLSQKVETDELLLNALRIMILKYSQYTCPYDVHSYPDENCDSCPLSWVESEKEFSFRWDIASKLCNRNPEYSK